jgi:hypothetical protein
MRELFNALPEDVRRLRLRQTPEEKKEQGFRKHLRCLRALAQNRLLPTLRAKPIAINYWSEISPLDVNGVPVDQHWRLLLSGLYPQSEDGDSQYLWIGELHESGRPEYVVNFETVKEWLSRRYPYGPQVSTALFRRWGHGRKGRDKRDLFQVASRSKEFAGQPLFWVLESDCLSKEDFGSVINRFARTRARAR